MVWDLRTLAYYAYPPPGRSAITRSPVGFKEFGSTISPAHSSPKIGVAPSGYGYCPCLYIMSALLSAVA